MSFTLTIKSNKFPQAPALMRKAIGVAFAVAGPEILEDENRRTPVDTGELRSSETVEATDESLTFRATAPHALFVHEGTHRMGARPFMREAVEAGVSTIEQAIATAAEAELG